MKRLVLLAGVAGLVCAAARADWIVTENVQLSADMLEQGAVTFGADVTIDLNGHKLEVSSISGSGAITDGSSGAPGELHVNVPSGSTTIDSVKLDGNFKFVKEGAGTLVIDKNEAFRNENRQYTYSGGMDILGGSVMLPMGTYPGHNGGRFFGDPVTVYPNGTLDTNGAYDYNGVNIVLAGGTLANRGSDTDNTGWGGNVARSLSADSFCDVTCNYLWHGGSEFNGHTLTINIPDGKRFYMRSNSAKNGRIVVPDNGGNNAGVFDVVEDNTIGSMDVDLYCVAELRANFNIRNFTYRGNGADVNNRSGVAYVSGVFTPLSDYHPNVTVLNGATIDLKGRTGAWNIESQDGHLCSFPDGVAVTLDVTGRTLQQGELVLTWTAQPENVGLLDFSFKDDATKAVLTQDGIVYGADPASTDVANATWTGNEGDGDVSKPGNWSCENAAGVALTGDYLPGAATAIYISGNTRINVPMGSGLTCAMVVFGDCTLSDDCDWSGLAEFSARPTTSTIDLGGHALTLGGFAGLGEITDTAGGTLRVNVPSGATVENQMMAITGELALVKVGEGTFVATASEQTYTGGTTVENGTLKAGTGDARRPFGVDGSQITVAQGATFDANGCGFFGVYRFVSNGGTLVLPASGSVPVTDFAFVNVARKFAGNEILVTEDREGSCGAAWWRNGVDPSAPWRATFTYVNVNGGDPADGFSFVFQSNGQNAVGGGGGNIGVQGGGVSTAVGCAYGIYGDDTCGWVVDGQINYTCAIQRDFGIMIQNGVDVVVEYDGNGTLVQTVSQVQNGTTKSVTITNNVDFSAKFSGMAYVGFTGACGGCWCEQRIRNFSFEQDSAPTQQPVGGEPVPVDLSVAGEWQFNGANCNPGKMECNGKPAIRVTDNYGQRGSAIFKTKIDATRPFAISGTYFAQNNGTVPFADGAGFIFHNDPLDTVGGDGTGCIREANGFTTSCGWAFVNFEGDRVRFVKNAAKDGSDCSLTGSGVNFSPKDREKDPTIKPINFTITYNYGALRLDLVQKNDGGVNRFTASHPVNLAEAVGSDTMYFALTGGTGGYYAEQYVYDLSYKAVEWDPTCGMGVEHVTAADGTTIVCPVLGVPTIAHLTLVDNASVAVAGAGAADMGYGLQVAEFLFAAQGASFPTHPALNFAANGGTLGVGGFTQTAENLGSFVTVTADALTTYNGPAEVTLPDFTGAVNVLDQRAVPAEGRLAVEDFAIVSPARDPKEVRDANGRIFAFRSSGMMIFMR